MKKYCFRGDLVNKFSEKVRIARNRLNLSQQELAELTGVSQRSIASYELGTSSPRMGTLRALAEALHVSTRYLADDTVTDPTFGTEEGRYVENVRSLYGKKAASEVEELLTRSTALFAGGDLSQQAKDDFFEAMMKAYFACKKEASRLYGKKQEA